MAVASIFGRMPLIVNGDLGWRNIVASSPDLDLLFTMLLYSFQFVQPLKSSVMSLVEPPVLDDRNVVTVDLISCVVEGLDGSGED